MQEAHTEAEQRANTAEKAARGIEREIVDLEAAVKATAGQAAARATAAAEQQLAVMQAELKVPILLYIKFPSDAEIQFPFLLAHKCPFENRYRKVYPLSSLTTLACMEPTLFGVVTIAHAQGWTHSVTRR